MNLLDEFVKMGYGDMAPTRIKLSDLKEGTEIVVKTWDGNKVRGVVEEVELDGKNGQPTIGYTRVSNGDGHWCYLDQVVRIVE